MKNTVMSSESSAQLYDVIILPRGKIAEGGVVHALDREEDGTYWRVFCKRPFSPLPPGTVVTVEKQNRSRVPVPALSGASPAAPQASGTHAWSVITV